MINWIKTRQRLKPVMNEANTAVIELTALIEDLKPRNATSLAESEEDSVGV